MSNLPTEIFALVFSHLNKRHLAQCILVSKIWKETAMPFFYKNLSLDPYHIFLIKKLLNSSLTEQHRYFHYGKFTKKICFVFGTSDSFMLSKNLDTDSLIFNLEEWKLLLGYFPNLQVLDLSESSDSKKYLQYLLEMDHNKDLLKIQTIVRGKKDKTLNDDHFTICYLHRDTITGLKVEYSDTSFNINSIRGQQIDLISHFNRLTHLKFRNICSPELTMFDIQAACPHLTDLFYQSNFRIPDLTLEEIDEAEHRIVDSNIKNMEIVGRSIPKNYIHHIANYVTPRIRSLKLVNTRQDLYDWINEIGYDNVLHLLNNMRNVKRDARIIWNSNRTTQLESTDKKSDMNVFYSLLHAIKGEDKIYCSSLFTDYRKTKRIHYTSKSHLYFEYGLKHHDIYNDLDIEAEINSDEDDYSTRRPYYIDIASPDRSKSTIGPEIINDMKVDMSATEPNLVFQFLDYALSHCPNLQRFSFNMWNTPNLGLSIGNNINTDKSNWMNQKAKLTHTTQETMKVVKTRNIFPSNEMLSLLNKYIPAMKILLCGLKTYCSRQRNIYEYTDFRLLANLELVQFDAHFFVRYRVNKTFITIEFSERQHIYYCLEIVNEKLKVTIVSFDYMNEQTINHWDYRSTIKCLEHVKFLVCLKNSRATEITIGGLRELDDKSSEILNLRNLD